MDGVRCCEAVNENLPAISPVIVGSSPAPLHLMQIRTRGERQGKGMLSGVIAGDSIKLACTRGNDTKSENDETSTTGS